MRIEPTQVNDILKTMTVSICASLQPAWPEYLKGCGGHGLVVAQIDPNANHLLDDADVVARGLVYMPSDTVEESHLRRLTIRDKDLDMHSDYVTKALNRLLSEDAFNSWLVDRDVTSNRIHATHTALTALLDAPVVDLHDPFRALRP